jgi:hypothetical protein
MLERYGPMQPIRIRTPSFTVERQNRTSEESIAKSRAYHTIAWQPSQASGASAELGVAGRAVSPTLSKARSAGISAAISVAAARQLPDELAALFKSGHDLTPAQERRISAAVIRCLPSLRASKEAWREDSEPAL